MNYVKWLAASTALAVAGTAAAFVLGHLLAGAGIAGAGAVPALGLLVAWGMLIGLWANSGMESKELAQVFVNRRVGMRRRGRVSVIYTTPIVISRWKCIHVAKAVKRAAWRPRQRRPKDANPRCP